MAPSKQPSLELINFKLDELKADIAAMRDENKTLRADLNVVLFWKSKVEDIIKAGITNSSQSNTFWGKYGDKAVYIGLLIIWGMLVILSGGELEWPSL